MDSSKRKKKPLVRADYRMIRYLANSLLDGSRVVGNSSSFRKVSLAFKRSGGSWERLFKGSVADLANLRKLIDYALASSILQKTSKNG